MHRSRSNTVANASRRNPIRIGFGRTDFARILIFEPPDLFAELFSSLLWEKVPRKILQKSPDKILQVLLTFVQPKSLAIYCEGPGHSRERWEGDRSENVTTICDNLQQFYNKSRQNYIRHVVHARFFCDENRHKRSREFQTDLRQFTTIYDMFCPVPFCFLLDLAVRMRVLMRPGVWRLHLKQKVSKFSAANQVAGNSECANEKANTSFSLRKALVNGRLRRNLLAIANATPWCARSQSE